MEGKSREVEVVCERLYGFTEPWQGWEGKWIVHRRGEGKEVQKESEWEEVGGGSRAGKQFIPDVTHRPGHREDSEVRLLS